MCLLQFTPFQHYWFTLGSILLCCSSASRLLRVHKNEPSFLSVSWNVKPSIGLSLLCHLSFSFYTLFRPVYTVSTQCFSGNSRNSFWGVCGFSFFRLGGKITDPLFFSDYCTTRLSQFFLGLRVIGRCSSRPCLLA